jgi:hypothetical protein
MAFGCASSLSRGEPAGQRPGRQPVCKDTEEHRAHYYHCHEVAVLDLSIQYDDAKHDASQAPRTEPCEEELAVGSLARSRERCEYRQNPHDGQACNPSAGSGLQRLLSQETRSAKPRATKSKTCEARTGN